MSKQQPSDTTKALLATAAASSEPSIILTPTSSSPPETPPKRPSGTVPITSLRSELEQKMDEQTNNGSALALDRQEAEDPAPALEEHKAPALKKSKANKCVKTKHKKKKSKEIKSKSHTKAKKTSHDDDSSDSSSSSDESDSEDEVESESSSEDEALRKKKAKSKHKKKLKEKEKARKRRRSKKQESSTESDESETGESEVTSEEDSTRKKKSKRKSKSSEVESDETDSQSDGENQDIIDLVTRFAAELKTKSKQRNARRGSSSTKKSSRSKSTKRDAAADALTYKRVDQLWDSSIHDYKLKESAEVLEGEFNEFAFLVRRTFDWEGKYTSTVVDIKSKVLRAVLAEVMKECKSVSLETEEPSIDPNLLFLYLDDLRRYYKKTLKKQIASEKKKKNIKKLMQKRCLTKTLCKYIDEDYADTKKTLYPLLESGNITFELLWALFTPNDIAITSCYGSWDEPRCFKVDYAMKYSSMTRGEWYCVEGKYLEYDGKAWGFGDFEVDIEAFKGPRKITSLASYPLKYHANPDAVKEQIIARGQRFVAMEPQEYKFHKGLAFMKKKKQVLKININGRVMIDPATFRRVNPNYPISLIKPNEGDDLWGGGGESDSDDDDCSCCDSDDGDAVGGGHEVLKATDADKGKSPRYKYKLVKDNRGAKFVAVEVDENGDPVRSQQLDSLQLVDKKRSYTEEELLLTSPVVLGFAFSEKLWLEFSLSGIHDITYNDQAFSSLVLPGDQKSTVHALVKSHKFHAAKTIDDVVQGKGRGLVFVLHGPPGTGKTLTAEGISELLRCPLYCVSAGELGTDPARLETELQKVLDIAHSWGALLLLDEADVFLEKRQVTDLHRNALVSIFLRLLEYFQGILFLTTNRVETFDDAFQSRIHVALRYDELTPKAKKEVWKNFIQMVAKQPGGQVAEFSEEDFSILSRHRLNGRQIKNTVRTAQALALNENAELTMGHIKRVLDVAETFDRDLKGGIGYVDAMRSYT